MHKKPLPNCPGCKLLVNKLEEDHNIKIKSTEIPTLINTVKREEYELRQKLSDMRNDYTLLDAQKSKENILLSLEVQNAESELQELLDEMKEEIAKQNTES